MGLQYGQLEEQGGIEHGVGVFLIRENPLCFSGAYARPAADGLFSRISAVVVVADDATQEAVVRRRDVVVRVQLRGRERGDIDAVLVFCGDVRRQFGVESVYAFEDEYHVVAQLQVVPPVFTCAGVEVEAGQFDAFAADEGLHVLVEQLQVERMERLVVIVAFFVTRSMLAVDEVIVERHGIRILAIGHELDRQPFAECRLA